jgi:hypothetical protein
VDAILNLTPNRPARQVTLAAFEAGKRLQREAAGNGAREAGYATGCRARTVLVCAP